MYRKFGGVWFTFFVTSLRTHIVASISWSQPVATMVNGYDVQTPVGHEERKPYRLGTPPDSRVRITHIETP